MWISKKRWQALERRVADLEREVQSQRTFDVSDKDAIRQAVQKANYDIRARYHK